MPTYTPKASEIQRAWYVVDAEGMVLGRKPTEAVRRSIRGMIPKTRLGRQQLTKLKVYAGPTHPHAAQKPQPLDVAHARRPTA